MISSRPLIRLAGAASFLCASHFAAAEDVEVLIKNALVVTMEAGQETPFSGYLTTDAEGRILAVEAGEVPDDLNAIWTFDAEGKVLMPGFLSGHSHLWQSAFRGLAAEYGLLGWLRSLQGTLAYRGFMVEGDLYAFTLHGALDYLRHGITTCYNYCASNRNFEQSVYDEQFYAEIDAGQRFVYGYVMPVWDDLEASAEAFESFYAKTLEHTDDPIFLKLTLASAGLRSGSDRFGLEVTSAEKYGLGMQMHYLEAVESQEAEREHFALIEELGGPWPWLSYAHFIHTDEHIIETSAEGGASMIWNPLSNGRLATGLAAVPTYLEAGIKVGMGIDGQASADLSDPFENMRMGLYQTRMRHESAKIMQPYDVLRLHTIGTAEAIGVEDRVGSLKPGKFADFLIVDPTNMDTGSVTDLYATLIFACSIANLDWVFVGGEPVSHRGELLRHAMPSVEKEVKERVAALRVRAVDVVPQPY